MKGIFGENPTYQEARLALLGVPWEATVSYEAGTVLGPKWIQESSTQLDFFDPVFKWSPLSQGIYFQYLEMLKEKSDKLRPLVLKTLQENSQNSNQIQKINQECLKMVHSVQEHIQKFFNDQKLFGVIGGDHSISEGVLKEVGAFYKGDFGLLHLDAHADMRKAYQGLTHSHASVMYNVLLQENAPQKIIQVGIRDLCEEEYQLISSNSRIECFFDHQLKQKMFEGVSWKTLTQSIIQKLPQKIYISLDVDALSWEYAPHTGCPVPGGLSFDQVIFLFEELHRHKKEIIGFDIVEVAPARVKNFGQWDGNVGARLAYKLCGISLLSQN